MDGFLRFDGFLESESEDAMETGEGIPSDDPVREGVAWGDETLRDAGESETGRL